ncbi:MAG TPA: MFS transporter [Caulobacteraceae bacterium]|jgi:MFS family permease
MAAAEAVQTAESRRLSVAVVPLLALAVFIQYIDRGNIATAAPLIKGELHLTAAQIGLLISAFYFTYTPGNLLSGWLAHRLNAYRTLALGLALWSAATVATGLAGSFVTLLLLRLALGLGESAFFPCSSRLLAQHLPPARLGAANGLIGIGLALGPAVGTWAGGNLMAVSGWRASFLIFGVASVLWLLPWRAVTRDLNVADLTEPRAPSPSYFEVIRRRELWGASLGHFCGNYAFYFVISWLPLYLVQERGFSMTEMAGLAGMIYAVYAVSCPLSGWLADRWMLAGASANRARKTVMISSLLVTCVSLVGGGFASGPVTIACLFAAAVGFGLGTSSMYAISQTLAGPNAAGKWMGFQNCVGNIAGIVGPVITGIVVDQTGSFAWAFIIAGCVALLGVVGWGVIIPKVAPLEWRA